MWEPVTKENELTRNSPGNIQPQLSQPAELLWTDPGGKSGINVHKLISIYIKKKAQAGSELSDLPRKILANEEKATTTSTGNNDTDRDFSC